MVVVKYSDFHVQTHLRVRDMCQYQIKTMSIDWKMIIVTGGSGDDNDGGGTAMQ